MSWPWSSDQHALSKSIIIATSVVLSVSRCHVEIRGALCRPARRRNHNLSGLRPIGNGSRYLSVGIYRKARRLHPAECDLRGLNETVAGDGYWRSDRTAGRAKADDLGRDPKILVAGQNAAGRSDGDRAGGSPVRDGRGQVGLRDDLEAGGSSVKGNARGPFETLAKELDGLADFGGGGEKTDKRPERGIEDVEHTVRRHMWETQSPFRHTKCPRTGRRWCAEGE